MQRIREAQHEQRVLPALPDLDEPLGKIRWESWEPGLVVTHLDLRCGTCSDPGPPTTCLGRTWYQPEPAWVPGQGQVPGYWCSTHWASRCLRCDETFAYRMNPWTEVARQPPTPERAVPPTDDLVLF